MALNLAPCPPSLKPIQHYLKTATEHEIRDPVIAYWCRLTALQTGLGLDKSSKEALAVLLPLMDWLERTKKEMAGNEAVSNEVVASAHIENHAMKLFLWADKEDRSANFNKNVVKAFYSSGMLFDVLTTFGELTPEVTHHKKYAKWKAAYIHNCLKNGETPVPGPQATGEEEDMFPSVPEDNDAQAQNTQFQPPPQDFGAPGAPYGFQQPPQQPYQPPQQPYQPPQQPYHPQFQAAQPVVPANPINNFNTLNIQQSGSGIKLSVEQAAKAQKYCKYAISSLDYDDLPTTILNLNKALHLCQTGTELQ